MTLVSELGKAALFEKMGSEMELNGKLEEAALGNENVTVQVPSFSESKEQKVVLQPGTDCKGIKETPLSGGNEEDVQVDIIGSVCVSSGGKVVEDACEDLTECSSSSSSSFGDTGSGIETASGFAFSDSEVESPMFDDRSEQLRLRKKKMTIHWRRFISPLMWRCKWMELQLKKLDSQALKYEKELAAYDYKKQLDFSKFTVNDFDVKSAPISVGIQRNKVMKRKKRKRAEEYDLSSYVSNHSIFSYYENKNCSDDACLEDFRSDAMEGNADNTEEFKLNDMRSSVDHEDNDKSYDDIIQKIEELQSQVEKLKARIDNVVSENPGKLCFVTRLSMIGPSDGFNHSGHNSASLTGNEDTFPVSLVHASSQHKSELYMEDLLLTENTLSTHEGITLYVETNNRPQLEVPQENTKDEVLIQNQAAKEELHDYENVRNQVVEGPKSISLAQVSEPDLVTENAGPNVHSTLKACSSSKSDFPRRNTRKTSGRKRSSRR